MIVGLGGGRLLKGLPGVLRLQLIAPPDVRPERVMAHDDVSGPLSHDRARDLIHSTDRDRSGYMRYLFNIDWSEPHHWDLVTSTGCFSVAETIAIVAATVSSGAPEPSAVDRQRLATWYWPTALRRLCSAIRPSGSTG